MALADWQQLVTDKLRDTASKIEQDAIDRAIQEAVKRYSRVQPLRRLIDLEGDGTTFLFALPADWIDGFSTVDTVEYPIGEQDPEYLDETDDYLVADADRDPDTFAPRLRLKAVIMPANTNFRVTYTTLHVVSDTDDADTVPVIDREATAGLATAICLRQLATYYAQTQDPTLGVDAVNYRTKSDDYARRAKDLEDAFDRQTGLGQAASRNADLDVDLQSGAGDRFFHPRRYR